MRFKVLFLVLVMAIGIVPASYGAQKKKAKIEEAKPTAEQILIDQAKEAVKLDLKDPDSAQFRTVRVKQREEEVVIGEVNSKNIYGGYSGYEKFYWGPYRDGKKYVWRESGVIDSETALNRATGNPQNPKESKQYRYFFFDGW